MHKPDAADTGLTNVHEALHRAIYESTHESQLKNCTFKVLPSRKQLAEQICARHGTTLSTYLRQCVNSLIVDYVAPRDLAEWEAKT